MVDIQSIAINPQDMTTEFTACAILEILQAKLEYLNLSRLRYRIHDRGYYKNPSNLLMEDVRANPFYSKDIEYK